MSEPLKTVNVDDDVPSSKPLYIFGRDVTLIPCFRRSFIFGICTGVVGGLACFLGTSKALFSTHVSFASLWIGVFAYWFPCRYQYESKKLAIEMAKAKKGEKYDKVRAEKEE